MASSAKAESVHSGDVVVVIESEKTSDFNGSSSEQTHTEDPQDFTTEQDQFGQKEEVLVDSEAASSTKGSTSQDNTDSGPAPISEVAGAGTLPFREVIVVFAGLVLGVFLASLDQTIVNVCSTKIASQFHSLTEIPWLGTAYFLTSTAFQPLYGKGSDIFGRKATFLFAISVFLIGSALCGAAQNMTWIIIARGVAGMGSAGIMSGVMIIITDLVSLRDRGKYQGIIGSVFGLSSVIGPLLGGVLTDRATWRWAFFINLPIGAITIFTVVKVLHLPHAGGSFKTKLARVDFAGSFTLIVGLIMVLLPLNWGGSTYPWNSARIIAMFCVGFAILGLFCFIEWKIAVEPIIPFRLFKKRTCVAVFGTNLCLGMGLFGFMFYMPLYYQIVRQETATDSGLGLLPMIIGLLIASISSGYMCSRWGHYRPFIWIGLSLATIGMGLMVLLTEDSSRIKIIGFLFLTGLGVGCVTQMAMLAIQSGVEPKDIAVATANAIFFRTVGSVLGVAICGAVFNNAVKNNLGPLILANPNVTSVIADPYDVRNFTPVMQAAILHAYMVSIRAAFRVCCPCLGVGLFISLFIKHHALRKTRGAQPKQVPKPEPEPASQLELEAQPEPEAQSERESQPQQKAEV
ncbi:hypothetical protein EMPS_08259 [Entomortierella parvispora]|uniref:Major facilitator superfamily (MFS) profile domain-containing protein n=1 Tax=Entomortierella parvispora TaxID=205924 RepID=A0A9P3HG01_9FUNG|nr:hypothetical protein EMPS_08259 [Entomortierella parvispora]